MVLDRFQVCCKVCGLLESFKSFNEALHYGRKNQIKHLDCGDLEIFDVMAHKGRPNLWTIDNVVKGLNK